MKKLTIPLLTAVAISMFVGCATTTGNSTVTPALVTLAVAEGSAVEMQSNPSSKPYFAAAATALTALENGTVTAAQVQSALAAAGVNGAESPAVAIGLQDGLNLIIQSFGTNGAINNVYITAIVTGLNQALAVNTPAGVKQLKAAYAAARKE